MKLPRIIRVPQHHKFSYTPRHYDAKKEDLERRVEMAKGQQENSPEATKERIRSQLRRGMNSNPELRKQLVFKSNMLLLGIIVILIVGLFIMINVYLPEIVK
jgi:ABC-type Fe3+/spermidine/putrescine transport system ATPase subunit